MNSKTRRTIGIRALAVLAAVAALATIAFFWHRATVLQDMKTCQENLTKLDGAKEQWSLENNKKPGDPTTWKDLEPPPSAYVRNPIRRCPSGAEYVLNPVGTPPICTSGLPGHSLSSVGAGITTTE